jgi:hypothetical protein
MVIHKNIFKSDLLSLLSISMLNITSLDSFFSYLTTLFQPYKPQNIEGPSRDFLNVWN